MLVGWKNRFYSEWPVTSNWMVHNKTESEKCNLITNTVRGTRGTSRTLPRVSFSMMPYVVSFWCRGWRIQSPGAGRRGEDRPWERDWLFFFSVILNGWLISRRTSTPGCPLPWQQVRTDSNDFDWSAADQSEVDQVKHVIMPVELFNWYFYSAAWLALSLW